MVGESLEENINERRVVQWVFLEPQHKKEHLQKERKNEKICTILEFLESNTCRMDNQVSKDNE